MREGNNIDLLRDFDTASWISWLKVVLAEGRAEPNIIFGDMTFDRKILWIKNELESSGNKTDKLSTAVFSLFMETLTNKNNAEEIYYLIQLLSVFKNQEFAAELETIFLKKELAGHYYKGVELNTVLLNAMFSFKSINDLSEFFHNILHADEKPVYYLLGLKYYCRTKEVQDYFLYLKAVVRKFIVTKYSVEIAEGIVNSLNELSFLGKGRHDIFVWWTENAKIYEQINIVFFETVRNKFGLWLNSRNKKLYEDLNLLNLKVYNDSLTVLDPDVFVDYASKIPDTEINDEREFENCLTALENYVITPEVELWDMFQQKDIHFTDMRGDKKKFNRTAWVLQKTFSAIARVCSNRTLLTKERRQSIKNEIIS